MGMCVKKVSGVRCQVSDANILTPDTRHLTPIDRLAYQHDVIIDLICMPHSTWSDRPGGGST